MEVKIINESGYEESLLGISLSYNQPIDKMKKVAETLSSKDGGHNKFLESIYVWLDITAPRFWWQEADTYRLSTKQSESTMHTITREKLTQDNFEYPIRGNLLIELNGMIDGLNSVGHHNDEQVLFTLIKNELPEGFLQRRIWVMNYKCLKNIYEQRKNHRLPQWKKFCKEILEQVEHPEFIKQGEE